MIKRVFPSGSLALLFFCFVLGCTKLDTTTIGSDLIPEVDNITTFADTFAITTSQGVFDGPLFKDTTRLALTSEYVVGKNDDPLFGSTDATLYLQLKPAFYPYFIGIPRDTIVAFDSVVLCLSYTGAYGDTVMPFQLQVSEVAQGPQGEWDSLGTLRDINYAPIVNGIPLSQAVPIDLSAVRRYRKIGKGQDSVINQIRIPLSSAFRDALFTRDSTRPLGAFSRDTLFRAFNNGFAINMTSGNTLIYTALSDANTRLELHYKRKNGGPIDTSMSVFTFNNGSAGSSAPSRSAVANRVKRTRNPLPDGQQEIYLQTAPGTFASLKIPQLTGYTNRIIHRAEIIMEQIPHNPVTDGYFTQPNFLYLDLVDSGAVNRWKPIYFDLNPSLPYDPDYTSGAAGLPYYPGTFEVDFSYFGGTARQKSDDLGPHAYYTINVSRYIQQLVTRQTTNYEMRLFAPHNFIYPQYSQNIIPYVNNIAAGRVRLAGGNYVDPSRRMRLRIIYSRLNN